MLCPFETVEQRSEIGGSVVHARTLEQAALKLGIRPRRPAGLLTPHPGLRGQDRTIRAITTQPTKTAVIPMPMTQPKVVDSGKGDIAASELSRSRHRLRS